MLFKKHLKDIFKGKKTIFDRAQKVLSGLNGFLTNWFFGFDVDVFNFNIANI